MMLSNAEYVCCDCENCENSSEDCCEAGKLLFFCLALVFSEEGICRCAADSAGKTAFFGALEKNENYERDGNEKKNRTENIGNNYHIL